MIKIFLESDKFSHIAGVTLHATNSLAQIHIIMNDKYGEYNSFYIRTSYFIAIYLIGVTQNKILICSKINLDMITKILYIYNITNNTILPNYSCNTFVFVLLFIYCSRLHIE